MGTWVCYSKTIMSLFITLAQKIGLASSSETITPRVADNTKIIPRTDDEYTYIPLQIEEEENNTVQFFVRRGAILTIKRGVNGSYDQEGTFRYRSGPVTHYLVEGVFTKSNGFDVFMTLLIPKNIVSDRFILKRDN